MDDHTTADAIEAIGDRFVVVGRRLVYYHGFVSDNGKHSPFVSILFGADDPGVPQWQRLLAPAMLPLQKVMLKNVFKLTEPSCRDDCIKELRDLTEQLEARLADSAHKTLLNSPEPSYVDFAVASCVACFMFLPAYTNGVCKVAGERERVFKEMPALRSDLDFLIKSDLAKWVTELYEKERNVKSM